MATSVTSFQFSSFATNISTVESAALQKVGSPAEFILTPNASVEVSWQRCAPYPSHAFQL